MDGNYQRRRPVRLVDVLLYELAQEEAALEAREKEQRAVMATHDDEQAQGEQATPLSEARLTAIRTLLQRIARAPWSVSEHEAGAMQVWADDGDRVAVVEGMQATADPARFADERENARFIAAAPTTIAALLAEVERLRARETAMLTEREQAREIVRAVADGRVIFGHVVTMDGIDAPNYVRWMTQARALLAAEASERSGDDGQH